jgi:hypothetical protein
MGWFNVASAAKATKTTDKFRKNADDFPPSIRDRDEYGKRLSLPCAWNYIQDNRINDLETAPSSPQALALHAYIDAGLRSGYMRRATNSETDNWNSEAQSIPMVLEFTKLNKKEKERVLQ